ncbi:Helicase superfamily 1/2, ATP-binding domain [Fusarium oxysporum f. sp. vasinfectum]|nr:Helicase superfamily 1/2, ATP-binding domain [Fusarium oxysporum f. sp. vasinfectum]
MDVDDQDTARACKRIRLESPEPDVYENFGDILLSDSELFPQLTCDSGFSASTLEPTKENKDESRLEIVGEALVAETIRDVCLGMIPLKATSSFFKNRQESEATVNLRQCGAILKLCTADTGAYAGIVTEVFPLELLDRPSVKLSALLTAPAALRIIMFSHIEEAAEIGALLSNNDLFLQHPSPRDIEYFELEAEYFNPHYLITPGSRMPQMEDLAIEYNDSTSNPSLTLDEQKKGQLMGVFDTAADLSIRPTTDPSPRLQTSLKDYQLKALTVMSEKECTNVERPQSPSLWVAHDAFTGGDREYRHRITGHRVDVPPVCAGGILADEMGLGKTLCVLSLICWSLDLLRNTEAQGNGGYELSTTLVVIPKSMIPGWQAQIKNHIVPGQIRVALYHGPGKQSLAKHFRKNDIVLTTYQTLRSEWTTKGPLFTEQWFRVVLDEAHRIGNRSTQVFQAACELQSSRRWCLTGTPIVNSIDNYGALLAFVQMEPLVAKATFDRWISNPIRDNVQEGLRKLRILVEATCLRRTKSNISQGLPPPTIRLEKVPLHPYDRALYDFFETEAAKNASDSSKNYPANPSETGEEKKNVLSLIHNLRRICDHGEDLLSASDIEAWRMQRGQGPDLQTMHYSGIQQLGTNCSVDSYCKTSPSAKVQRLIQKIRLEQTNNLARSATPPVKSVVFSYWTKMLDLVQKALLQASFLCERIDGKYSIKQREKALSRFANDPCCTVMLATIGSGGEGIDLTSANNVHLLEPHWNPMAEEQAIARVHRIGQQRHVTATKYITPDSIEEYVQSIQVKKTQLIQDTWSVNDDSHGNSMDYKALGIKNLGLAIYYKKNHYKRNSTT